MANPEYRMETDQSLVSRALSGEMNAFRDIVKLTEKLTADICFKMAIHPEDKKDLVQEIYLKAWKNLAGFRFQSRLTTWLAQIAYNTCLNYLNKKKFPVVTDLTGIDAEYQREHTNDSLLASPLTDAATLISQSETKKIIALAIEGLPPVYKTIITLFHYHDMGYEEIGIITGLPVGTVKSYLYRARKTLKESLLSQYKKEEL